MAAAGAWDEWHSPSLFHNVVQRDIGTRKRLPRWCVLGRPARWPRTNDETVRHYTAGSSWGRMSVRGAVVRRGSARVVQLLRDCDARTRDHRAWASLLPPVHHQLTVHRSWRPPVPLTRRLHSQPENRWSRRRSAAATCVRATPAAVRGDPATITHLRAVDWVQADVDRPRAARPRPQPERSPQRKNAGAGDFRWDRPETVSEIAIRQRN